MKKTTLLLAFITLLNIVSSAADRPTKILIVPGGHDFQREGFFALFNQMKGITYREEAHPGAMARIGALDPASFDAVVFYDMPKNLTDEEKDLFHQLTKSGKGLLFLHHSICSYQDWNDYINFVGGKYYEKKKDESFGASSYQHDVHFTVNIVTKNHPVTNGLSDFEILDEVYGNLEVLPHVQPLLSTNHPKSNPLIGWTFQKDNSRIVTIQPGHDQNSWTNPNYTKLIRQAIAYIANEE